MNVAEYFVVQLLSVENMSTCGLRLRIAIDICTADLLICTRCEMMTKDP